MLLLLRARMFSIFRISVCEKKKLYKVGRFFAASVFFSCLIVKSTAVL